MEAVRTESPLSRAVRYLNAKPYQGGLLYGYTERQCPGEVFIVDRDEVRDLGKDLALDSDTNAYSLLCQSTGRTVTAWDVVQNTMTKPEDIDLDALRTEAAAADDIDTVIAIDLIRDAIESEISSRVG
jgi:hypothetical protein